MDLKEEKYQELVNKKYEIESQGMSATYVDKEFLSLIVNSTMNYENYQKLIKSLAVKFNIYYEKINELDNKIKNKIDLVNEEKETVKKKLNEKRKLIVKDIIRTFTSLGSAIGLAIGAFALARAAAKETKYKTTTTTYSTIADTTAEEEYVEYPINSRYLYKYSPYEKDLKYFSRNVTISNISSLEDLTFEEYLSLDLTSLGIKETTKEEIKGELSLSDLYDETYYVLKEVNFDKLDKIEGINNIWILFCAMNEIIGFLIYVLLEVLSDKIYQEKFEKFGFIDSLIRIRESFNKIKQENKSLDEKRKRIRETY